MDLTNSKRTLLNSNYVVVQLTSGEQTRLAAVAGRGIEKLNLFRALNATVQDLTSIEKLLNKEQDPHLRAGYKQLLAAARPVLAGGQSNAAFAALFAPVPFQVLDNFSKNISARDWLGAWVSGMIHQRQAIAPVGRLHLERLEMYPAGIERGELMFTIPMAPGETITVSHKEWSSSEQEYQDIVTDFFEGYSEKGVAEKSDASMSAENETQHTNAFNFNASASGGYGPVSVSTSVGLSSSSQDRQAVKSSMNTSRDVTEKASARTRKEHKVSIKLETKSGAADSSFRTITNPYPDRAFRIDFYRMMRKWRTDLYRYGLRLTFDVAIPNPGSRLWTKYRQLTDLDNMLRQPFSFNLTLDKITDSSWPNLVAQYQAAIDPPPQPTQSISITKTLNDPAGGLESFQFVAAEGYLLSGNIAGEGVVIDPGGVGVLRFVPQSTTISAAAITAGSQNFKLSSKGIGGTLDVAYPGGSHTVISVVAVAKRSDTLVAEWQLKAWNTLHDAAVAQYQASLARMQDERNRLWNDLAGKDTLTLRRMEREELLDAVIEWLVGPDLATAPAEVAQTIETILKNEATSPPVQDLDSITPKQWSQALAFGEFVKFIHQSVEWENMLYFLYPYFWGSEELGREKMLFDHPDPLHRDFLRAGYARVVIPIRPGYEPRFLGLLETGDYTQDAPSSPYMTIADEVAAFARTNYNGIPPANPENHSRPLLYPQQRETWTAMMKAVDAIENYNTANGTYPTNLAAVAGGPYQDAWGRDLVYRFPGSGNDYDLFSYGADGVPGGDDLDSDISAGAGASLIASWHDYTPTSGTDIVLDEKFADMA